MGTYDVCTDSMRHNVTNVTIHWTIYNLIKVILLKMSARPKSVCSERGPVQLWGPISLQSIGYLLRFPPGGQSGRGVEPYLIKPRESFTLMKCNAREHGAPEIEHVAGKLTESHEESCNCSSRDILRASKLLWMRWVGHVAS
jgi:hypothetical protein